MDLVTANIQYIEYPKFLAYILQFNKSIKQSSANKIMYQLNSIGNKKQKIDNRVIDSLPSDRGKRHFWQLDKGDYGLYQSQQKTRVHSQALHNLKQNKNCHWHTRHQTQPANQYEYYKQNYSSLQKRNYGNPEYEYQEKIRRRRDGRISNISQRQLDDKRFQDTRKDLKNFKQVNQVILPTIKKVQKQVQTSGTQNYFHPTFSTNNQNSMNQKYTNNIKKQAVIPNSLVNKKKLSEKPRVEKIGHETDQRYDKYENTVKNPIKIKTYKSYLKYTPTYASSQNNLLSHYFGDGPIEYQKDEQNYHR